MGLRVRTVLALAVAVVPGAAGVVAWTWLLLPMALDDPGFWSWAWVLAPALVLLLTTLLRSHGGRGRETAQQGAPVHEAVVRLSEQVGLPRPPEVTVVRDVPPNLWIEGWAFGRLRICIERSLVDRLDPADQAALVAHELAHLVNHDARWMAIADAPARSVLAFARACFEGGRSFVFGLVLWPVGQLLRLLALPFSRSRELLADETAARMLGDPLRLAVALQRVAGRLDDIPRRDLRAARARDTIHLLPVGGDRGGLRRIAATHPRLDDRVARLERLAAELERDRRRR